MARLMGQQPQQAAPATPSPQQQAQPRADRSESAVTRVIPVHRGQANQFLLLLQGLRVRANHSDDLGVIVVTGEPDEVAKYEQKVREIEKNIAPSGPPPLARNVQLTLHILGIVEDDSSTSIQASLQPVVAELKKTLPFRGYRLLETTTVRGRVGQQAHVQGVLPSQPAANASPTTYEFSAQINGVTPEYPSPIISLGRLGVALRTAAPSGTMNTVAPGGTMSIDVNTALDIADGTIAVIGKSGSAGDTQGYVMLLEAKVLN
jgi:hypothetical protein